MKHQNVSASTILESKLKTFWAPWDAIELLVDNGFEPAPGRPYPIYITEFKDTGIYSVTFDKISVQKIAVRWWRQWNNVCEEQDLKVTFENHDA